MEKFCNEYTGGSVGIPEMSGRRFSTPINLPVDIFNYQFNSNSKKIL
jgi:hypothetical protein